MYKNFEAYFETNEKDEEIHVPASFAYYVVADHKKCKNKGRVNYSVDNVVQEFLKQMMLEFLKRMMLEEKIQVREIFTTNVCLEKDCRSCNIDYRQLWDVRDVRDGKGDVTRGHR